MRQKGESAVKRRRPDTLRPLLLVTQASTVRARIVVMEIEGSLGFLRTDRDFEKPVYDAQNSVPGTGKLCSIEVKGRVSGTETIRVTVNEMQYSLNEPDVLILAKVEFFAGYTHKVLFRRQPFKREPDYVVTNSDYSFSQLSPNASSPR